jgi:hypothetical protein
MANRLGDFGNKPPASLFPEKPDYPLSYESKFVYFASSLLRVWQGSEGEFDAVWLAADPLIKFQIAHFY